MGQEHLPYAAASPSAHSLPLLQSIVTAARYQSTQGQASLFAITVASMIETHGYHFVLVLISLILGFLDACKFW